MEGVATATNGVLVESKNAAMDFSVVLGHGTPPYILAAMVMIIAALLIAATALWFFFRHSSSKTARFSCRRWVVFAALLVFFTGCFVFSVEADAVLDTLTTLKQVEMPFLALMLSQMLSHQIVPLVISAVLTLIAVLLNPGAEKRGRPTPRSNTTTRPADSAS